MGEEPHVFLREKEEQKLNKEKIALPFSFPFHSIFTNIVFGISLYGTLSRKARPATTTDVQKIALNDKH